MIKFFEFASTSEFVIAQRVIEDIKTIATNFYHTLALQKKNVIV